MFQLTVSTVPGPCDPEDLIDGIIFAANYLGSTQLLSERTPTKSARMQQAQEAMTRVRVRNTPLYIDQGRQPESPLVNQLFTVSAVLVCHFGTCSNTYTQTLALHSVSYKKLILVSSEAIRGHKRKTCHKHPPHPC